MTDWTVGETIKRLIDAWLQRKRPTASIPPLTLLSTLAADSDGNHPEIWFHDVTEECGPDREHNPGMTRKTTAVLTISGTDPSGREEIQADLKTFAAHGCHGTSVVTAVTAKTTNGVQRHVLPPDFVEAQITSTLKDIRVNAVKTGTLFGSAIARSVASSLGTYFRSYGRVPFVCDSVYVSDCGIALSREDIQTIVKELFPIAQVVTLREVEAQYLLNLQGYQSEITSLYDMLVAAQNILTLGPRSVLLKGGPTVVSLRDIFTVKVPSGASLDIQSDFPLCDNIEILGISKSPEIKDSVVDVLCYASTSESAAVAFILYPQQCLKLDNIQGVDTTFSAALSCALGDGIPVEKAVAQAITFTRLGIETASHFGRGSGSSNLNHLHSTSALTIHPKTSKCSYPLAFRFIQNTAGVWKQYVRHDFVVQLGKGTLNNRSFQHFMEQDYLYLKYYARAYALLASKFNDYASINDAAKAILGISDELPPGASVSLDGGPLKLLISRKKSMHASFFTQWGTSPQHLEKTPESPATTAYGAFLIDTGLRGDTSSLIMAVAACLLGYGEVGLWLKREAQKQDSWVVWQGNPYLAWMEEYSGKSYQAGVVAGLELMELLAEKDAPSQSRYDVWFSIWERTVAFEKGFWDMALNLS